MNYFNRPHNLETIEELKKLRYDEYLQSKWWTAWSKIYKGEKCEQCGRKYELNVHHLTYENIGDEKSSDVITLCKRCHIDFHYNQRFVNPTKKMILKQHQITQKDWEQWQKMLADR